MNKLLRKSLIVLMSVILMSLSFTPAMADTESDFDAFLEKEWKDTMEEDYLTMHSSVSDWRKLGLEKPEVTLGDINYDEFKETVDIAEEALNKLHEFNIEELSEARQCDYRAYENYLECLIGMYSYPDLQFMFRPYTGYLTNVTDYFADFPFYEKQDVEDYLTLIAELPSYIEQMKEFTTQQAEKGYFLDDLSYSDEMSELNEQVEKGEKNPMILNFNDNIDKFDGITEAEKKEYKEKNKDIVLNEIIPAYRDVRSFLTKLKGSRSVETGALVEYTDNDNEGKTYYENLVRYYTSSNDSMEDIFNYLNKALKDVNAYYEDLIDTNPDFEEPAVIENMEELDDFLTYLREHMDGFPKGPEVDYTPSYLPEGSNDFAMAYYIPAPVDNVKQNIIRVNKEQTSDVNTLYYTLAHEGFPGHLYQFTWFQSQENYVPLRHEMSFMGYEEGWANYVEKVMLDRSGLDYMSAEYLALDEILAYALYGAADIAVNGLGYDVDQLSQWIEESGFNKSFAQDIYDISVEMPGSYLPYGFGVCKFWEFRERVQAALGDDFDLEEFHYQILNNGPRPFDLVEDDLKAYVESKGASMKDDFTFLEHERTPEMGPASTEKSLTSVLIPVIAVLIIVIAVLVFLIVRSRRKPKGELEYEIVEKAETMDDDPKEE